MTEEEKQALVKKLDLLMSEIQNEADILTAKKVFEARRIIEQITT